MYLCTRSEENLHVHMQNFKSSIAMVIELHFFMKKTKMKNL